MDNKTEIYKVLNLLKVAYAYIERDRSPAQLEQMVKLYCELLADVPPGELRAAALQHIAQSKFFPTVAELREVVHDMHRVADNTPTWEAAWNEMLGEIRRVGYMAWADTKFSTDHIRTTARTFWRDACLADLDYLPTIRAQFRDCYNAKARRAEDERARLPVTNQIIRNLADTFRNNGKLPFAEIDAPRERQ